MPQDPAQFYGLLVAHAATLVTLGGLYWKFRSNLNKIPVIEKSLHNIELWMATVDQWRNQVDDDQGDHEERIRHLETGR